VRRCAAARAIAGERHTPGGYRLAIFRVSDGWRRAKIVRPARTGTVQAGRANRRGGGRGADTPIALDSSPRPPVHTKWPLTKYWSRAIGIWFTPNRRIFWQEFQPVSAGRPLPSKNS